MSYFDNQYGGEDEDDKFQKEASDNETSSDIEEDDEVDDDNVEDDEVDDDNVDDDDVDDDDVDDDDVDDDDVEDDENQEGGDPDSELEEGALDEDVEKKSKKIKKIPAKNVYKKTVDFVDENEDDDDNEGEQYLQKFDRSINNNYILNFHPESVLQNYDEILSMTKVVRNSDDIIIDKLHRTIPYLTKYEKARILGQRAKQINSGAYPFVKVPENVIDGYIIAELELKQKRIPFIIRRPLPNGGSEYWRVQDLEDISF
jgi:DNA-directed RNA polymerase subunit K/omega